MGRLLFLIFCLVLLSGCEFEDLFPDYQPGETMSLPFPLDEQSRLYRDDFETGTQQPFWAECLFCGRDEGIVSGLSVKNGDHAFRIHYDEDESSAWLLLYPVHFESVYVSFWQYFPDGLAGHSIKQFRIANHRGIDSVEGYFNLQAWGNGQNDAYFGFPDIALYYLNPIPKSMWVRTELYVRYNTTGKRNGVFWQKTNGQFIMASQNAIYHDGARVSDLIGIGGNYSNAGTDPVPFDRYIDDIIIVLDPPNSYADTPAINYPHSAVGDWNF